MTTAIPAAPAISVREVFDFMARHLSNRHVKALSEVAGLNSANVYASLAGRRPLPVDTIRRLADATGLQVHEEPDIEPRLSLRPDMVLTFDATFDELPELARVFRALCSTIPSEDRIRECSLVSPLWATNLVVALECPGVYAIVIVHLRRSFSEANSYAVVQISWPSYSAAKAEMEKPEFLNQHIGQLVSGLVPRSMSADNRLWVQLRSGYLSARELDKLCNVSRMESEPTAADWGRLLEEVGKAGLSPGDLISQLDLVQRQFSR
jgi:hypothetical protein